MENINEVQIGKYTLESLTTGMYSDPKIVYREYIQNSVDSLEEAVENGIIEKQCMRIDIIVDDEVGKIIIRDNGTGIAHNEAKQVLLNIGNSKKRHNNNRGFRGIGRLGGMSYCNWLIFSTSAEGEDVKTIVKFNCKKLRELLIPGAYEDYDLFKVLDEVTIIETEIENEERHYFSVSMEEVSDFSDILRIDEVKKYISQVAPISYKTKNFLYTSELHQYLDTNNYRIEEFPIFVGIAEDNLEPVYKPNRFRFFSDRNKKREDLIGEMKYFNVIIDNELYAVGWYADCEWYGTLSDNELSGLRLRKGNILIGDSKTLSTIYREARFNGWVQGEIFVLTDKLIPNARRDDFEQNEWHSKFLQKLSDGIGMDITNAIRDTSRLRNDVSTKTIKEVIKQVKEAEVVLIEGFNSSVDREKMLQDIQKAKETLNLIKNREDLKPEIYDLNKKLDDTVEVIAENMNFKINQINSGIDKKSKKILSIISDILSLKLSKVLVDEILEEIISILNKK